MNNQELFQVTNEITALTKYRNNLSNEIENLSKEKVGIEQHILNLNQETELIRSQHNMLKDSMAALAKERKEVEAYIGRCSDELHANTQHYHKQVLELQEIQKSLTEQRINLENRENDFNTLKSQYDQDQILLNAQKGLLEAKISDLGLQIRDLEDNASNAALQLLDYNKAVISRKKELGEYTDKCNGLRSQLDQSHELEVKIKELETVRDGLVETIDHLMDTKQRLWDTIHNEDNMLTAKRIDVEKSIKRLEGLRQKILVLVDDNKLELGKKDKQALGQV